MLPLPAKLSEPVLLSDEPAQLYTKAAAAQGWGWCQVVEARVVQVEKGGRLMAIPQRGAGMQSLVM